MIKEERDAGKEKEDEGNISFVICWCRDLDLWHYSGENEGGGMRPESSSKKRNTLFQTMTFTGAKRRAFNYSEMTKITQLVFPKNIPTKADMLCNRWKTAEADRFRIHFWIGEDYGRRDFSLLPIPLKKHHVLFLRSPGY